MLTNEDTTLADTNGDSSAAGFAELALAQMYVLPETIQSTDAVTFGADVRNDGTVDTGAFQVRFSLDAVETHEVAYPSLRPGESHWEEWQHGALAPGEHTFGVTLDSLNQVVEGNKYDNSDSLSFHVADLGLLQEQTLASDSENGQAQEEMIALDSDDSNKAKKRKKTTTVDFSDEPEIIEGEAYKLDPGISGPQYIIMLAEDLRDRINDYWNNYRDGLANFETSMSFESGQEAEAKYMQAVFKGVAKEALGMVLEKAGEELGGPWGKIISITKAAVEAWAAEKERSENAQGKAKIAEYIQDLRDGISGQQTTIKRAMESQRSALLDEFNRTGTDHPQYNKVGANGEIYGPQATLLKQLRQHVDNFEKAVPAAPYFQEQFTTRFANTPGWTDLISHGARLAGMLYFSSALYKDGDKWTLKGVSEKWKLVTKAPEPERAAASLERSLRKQGKKPYQSDLPKMVHMSIEIEESFSNSYIDGYIHFTSNPDQFDVRTNYGEELFKEAWDFVEVRKTAFDTAEIEGSSE